MEPRIQYAQTADGVSIAYYAIGDGPPLVRMPPMLNSHLQLEWQIAEVRRSYERIARYRTLVRYDTRGSGLSDRDVTEFTVDALVRDLEAVADRLDLDRFALLASGNATPVAIAYGARHPERLSHLVLWHGYPRPPSDWSRALEGLLALAEKDWELAIAAFLQSGGFEWSEGSLQRQFAALMREAVTPETFVSFYRQYLDWDVSDLLSSLVTPTLVAQRRQYRLVSMQATQKLAAAIPHAQLLVLEGSSMLMGRDFNTAIDEFLGEGEEAAAAPQLPEGMAVILFADIVESTALTEQMGDTAFRSKARELDTALRAIIRECSGTPVEGKLLGDGVLAVFTTARQAIECALRCGAAGEPLDLRLHLGIHAGDVIREGDNVYGGAVNIAARIAGASAPGEVLVSDTVRGLARTSAGVAFDDRGEQALKGIAEPQRLFAVREGG